MATQERRDETTCIKLIKVSTFIVIMIRKGKNYALYVCLYCYVPVPSSNTFLREQVSKFS